MPICEVALGKFDQYTLPGCTPATYRRARRAGRTYGVSIFGFCAGVPYPAVLGASHHLAARPIYLLLLLLLVNT